MLLSVDHLLIFFSHRNVTGPVMSSRGKGGKRRLDRRNAAKHIDYDAGSDDFPLITRSLELSDKTSFRIEGIEGEIDVICRTLGLSGPDDFAISTAAWEARKIRSSSDLFPRTRFSSLDTPITEKGKEKSVRDEDMYGRVLVLDGVPLQGSVELTRGDSDELEEGECSTSNRVVVATEFKLNPGPKGINGIRPPALKPPPVMALKPLDDHRSTWDLLRDFAPESDRIRGSLTVQNSSSDESGGDEEFEEAIAQMEGAEDTGGRIGETAELSTSCSFTTSIDDDSSTSTTEPDLMSMSPNGKWKRIITGWEKGPLLGRGSFGAVYEGMTDDGFFFAVKEVSLLDQGSQGQQSISQLEQEIALLSQFEHENIVQYFGTEKELVNRSLEVKEPDVQFPCLSLGRAHQQQDESKVYIFLEFVTKGSLLSLYQKYKLRDSQVSAYTRQILQGLKYLHERNVVHRDIKCANILVHSSGSVKLADFGLAKATKLNDVKSCKGTPFWMAPEVVNRKNQGYGIPADIWSLGCTVLEMLTGHIPYSDLEPMSALFRIGKGEPPPIPDDLSKDAREFVLKCLQVKPDQRPSAAELLNHPFLKWRPPVSSGSSPPYSSRQS